MGISPITVVPPSSFIVDNVRGVSKMSAKTTMLPPLTVSNGMSYNGIHADVSVSSLPPIEVSNRRSQAWRVLRESIVNGRLPTGTKLIGSQLAEQLGVSRTPLREAIQLLEREGFVKRLPSGVVEVVGLGLDEIEEVYAIPPAWRAWLRATPPFALLQKKSPSSARTWPTCGGPCGGAGEPSWTSMAPNSTS